MRRIVFVLLGLFAVFTVIRAYEETKNPAPESRRQIQSSEFNYADVGSSVESDTGNL